MTTSRALTFAACLLSGALLAAPAPAAAPTPPPSPQTAPADPAIQDLLRRLASTNTAEREAAQKQLAAIAALFDQTDVVQRFADATSDSELKSLFQSRIGQIKTKEEEKRLAKLPPITVTLKSASLSQTIDALNKELNTSTKLMFDNTPGNPATFNLDVKDKPFWEVFTALQDQFPLDLSNSGNNQLRVMPIPTLGVRRYAISGPAMAWVTNVMYSRNITYRTPTDASSVQPQLYVIFTMAVDPRMRATQFRVTSVTNATDDEGRNYRANNTGYSGSLSSSSSLSSTTNLYGQQLSVVPPERLGKTLSISFDGSITTTVGDPVVTIDDIQNSVNKPFTMGNRTVRIIGFSNNISRAGAATSVAQFQISVTASNSSLPEAIAVSPSNDPNTQRINYSVLDATGRTIISSTISSTGTTSGSIPLQNSTPPYKLELRAAGRPIEIPVHFDLKDLPLP